MRARLVVFPIRGRNWCFAKSLQPSLSDTSTAQHTPSTFKQLWTTILSSQPKSSTSKPELLVDFAANKVFSFSLSFPSLLYLYVSSLFIFIIYMTMFRFT